MDLLCSPAARPDEPILAVPPAPEPAWTPCCPACHVDLWDGIGRRWLTACDRCSWQAPAEQAAA